MAGPCTCGPGETWSRVELEAQQWRRVSDLLRGAWDNSPFYRGKWQATGLGHPEEIRSLADLSRLGFTSRAEFRRDQAQNPPWGTLPTVTPEQFVAVHASEEPAETAFYYYDDAAGWEWVQGLWDPAYRSAGVRPGDRVFFACAFAPVLWYWTGFERAQAGGSLVFPGGAMSPLQRVQNIFDLACSVLVTTPAEGLEMARAAAQQGFDLARSPVRAVIYTGLPGGDADGVGERLGAIWGAAAFGVTWVTEAGLTGFECPAHPGGVHLMEHEVYCEVVDRQTGEPVPPGQTGELVVTPLGRRAMPVIRFRTGMAVRVSDAPCACGRTLRLLRGETAHGVARGEGE